MGNSSTDFKANPLAKLAQDLMHKGIVRLTFIKKNGETRVAVATTAPELVYAQTKSGQNWEDEYLTPFFDIELGRWRSFRNNRLVSVVNLHTFGE